MGRNRPIDDETPPTAEIGRKRSRRPLIILIILLGLGVCIGAAYMVGMAWAERRLSEMVQTKAHSNGFAVEWDRLDIELTGTVRFSDVRFRSTLGGELEGTLEWIETRLPLHVVWTRELPNEITLHGLATRMNADGLRALWDQTPGESTVPRMASGSEFPRLVVETMDSVFHIDDSRSVACRGRDLSFQVGERMELEARLTCHAPDFGIETGPFQLELTRDPTIEEEPWQIQLAPEESFQAELADARFGHVLASLGSQRATVNVNTVTLSPVLSEEYFPQPPHVRLNNLEFELYRRGDEWRAHRIEAGSGEVRLTAAAQVDEPENASFEASDEEDEDALALDEAEASADEVTPILPDWEAIESWLTRLADDVDQVMNLATHLADRMMVADIDLVVQWDSTTSVTARLESLTAQPGSAVASLRFADHPFQVVIERVEAESGESNHEEERTAMALTVETQRLDLGRVSETVGHPGLITGLTDVDLRLETGETVDLNLVVDLPDLVFFHEAVSPLALELLPLRLDMNAQFSAQNRYPLRMELSGALGEEVRGNASFVVSERYETTQLDVDLRMDEMRCRDLLAAIPDGLFIHFAKEEIRITGRTAFEAHVRYRFGDHRSFRITVPDDEEDEMRFPGTCEITHMPEGYRTSELLRNDFRHRVFEEYTTEEIWVGPGTDGYRRLEDLPGYVPAIMYLTEQRMFYEDPPLSVSLISKAVRVNLIYGRWAYGGSTVTQQLVKNLFLDRGKTLARKFEEALISWVMETVVPKDRILELYINCIEFGPDVWGIEAGAQYYFGIHADDLSPIQASWLAGLKPSPRSGERHRRRGHSPRHGRWPRRLEHHLQLLADRGLIDQDYVDIHRPYVVEFIDPRNPQPRIEPLE